jgi:hypothetical protein
MIFVGEDVQLQLHSIKDNGWTPLYYCSANGKIIVADNVARIYGCQLA